MVVSDLIFVLLKSQPEMYKSKFVMSLIYTPPSKKMERKLVYFLTKQETETLGKFFSHQFQCL